MAKKAPKEKSDKTITLGGRDYPYRSSVKALELFEQETGASALTLNLLDAEVKAYYKHVLLLIYRCIQAHYKAAGLLDDCPSQDDVFELAEVEEVTPAFMACVFGKKI